MQLEAELSSAKVQVERLQYELEQMSTKESNFNADNGVLFQIQGQNEQMSQKMHLLEQKYS